MTISYSSFGAAAYSISNPTPGYPASLSANDLILLFVGTKPDTSSCDVNAPGWIELTDASGTGGTGTTGADTGPMRVQTWAKYATGSESGTLTVTNDGNNSVSGAVMLQFTKTSDLWDLQAALGNDTTTGTPFTASATLDLAVGDIVVACGIIPTDITTPSQFSAESFTASGITFDTATEVIELDSSSGNDMGGVVAYAKVTAGSSSSVSTTFSATAGGTTTNVAGPIAFVRLRERAIATGTDGSALREDFESGVLNNPIGTTDGIFDGGGETGSGTQMYYSGVQYHSGSKSAYLDTDGSTGTLWRDIWGPSSDVSRMYFGGYLWVPSGATPTATEPIFVARTDSGNNTARIVLLSGTLTLTTQDGTAGSGDGYTIPTNQWVRWEWDVNPGGGKQRLSLYFGSNLEGNYPNWWEDNTCTSQTTVADLRVGWNTATSSAFYLYFDDLGYSYSNEVGPKLAGPTTYQGTAAFSGASTFTATGTVKTNATAAFSGAGSFGSSFSDNALEAEYFYPYEGGSITTSYGIFDGGSDSGGGSWTPDSAHSIIGSQSGKLYLPSGTQSYRSIDTGTVTKLYVRTYVWVSSVDIAGSNFNMLQVEDSSKTRVARLVVTTAEEMRQQDDSTGVGSTWAFLFDQWVRVEWFLDSDNNTQTFRVFHGSNLHGTTPDTEISSTFTTGSDIKYLRIGPSVGSMTNALTAWYDAVGYRTSDWTGPSIEGTGPIGSVYPPTTIHNGSASFSGDSTLTATATLTKQGSASFSGDSTLTSTATLKKQGSASFSGDSTLTATSTLTNKGSASFSGDSGLSAVSLVTVSSSVAFSGDSTLNATGTIKKQSSADFSANSDLGATGTRKQFSTAAFSGDSGLNAGGLLQKFSTVNFSGDSSFASSADIKRVANSSFSADSFMTTDATVITYGSANLSSQSFMTIDLGAVQGSSSLSGNATMTTDPTLRKQGSSDLSGSSSLVVSGTIKKLGSSSVSAQSSLTATGSVTSVGSVAFSGDSTFSCVPSVTRQASATLSSQSSFVPLGTDKTFASIALSSESEFSVNGLAIYEASTILSGQSSMSMDLGSVQGIVSMSANGTLTSAPTVKTFGAVSLDGTTSMTVDGTVKKISSISLDAASSMSSTGSVTSVSSASFSAISNIVSTALVTKLSSIEFSGSSSISSSGAVTYQASINFRADSDIFITSIRKQFGDASLSGQSNITIDVGGIVNSSISFSGNATLSVIPTVSIFGAAEFSGYSSIDVASTLKAYGISTFSADSNIYANSSLKKLATIAFSGDSSIEASSTVKTFSLANFDAISTLYADAELINSLYLGVFGIPIQ